MTNAPAASTKSNRLPFVFLAVTLVLDAIGVGLVLPVMPDLIRDLNGGNLASAATWGGLLATCFALMQFVFGPIIGALSDEYGRRPVLLVSLSVMCLDYLISATAGSVWILLASHCMVGIASATYAVAGAFIADVSPPEKKAQNFGILGAAFGVGFVLGPALGGVLAEFGTRAPFFAAAGLTALNFAFGYMVMPETVTDATRRRFDLRRSNPLSAFRAIIKLPQIRWLIAFVFVYEFAFIAYPATWAYFTQERFGWSPAMVGYSLAIFGLAMAAVQGGLIRILIPRFGARALIWWGVLLNLCAFVAFAFLTNSTLFLITCAVTALGAVVNPSLLGLISRQVSDDAQGEVQGVIASTRAVALIFAPITMTQLFSLFADKSNPPYQPGAPFILSAILMCVCALLLFISGRAGSSEAVDN